MKVYCVFLLTTLVSMASLQTHGYHMEFFESQELGGGKLSYYHGFECVNVRSVPRVSMNAVDTHGNCVTLYEQANCQGRSVSLAPGTSSHNNLGIHGIDMKDKVASFMSCDLSECQSGSLCRRGLRKGMPEYTFWVMWLAAHNWYLRDMFLERSASGAFIYWDFQDFIKREHTPSMGNQYQVTMEHYIEEINKIPSLDRSPYTAEQLGEFLRTAQRTLDDRVVDQLRYTTSLGLG